MEGAGAAELEAVGLAVDMMRRRRRAILMRKLLEVFVVASACASARVAPALWRKLSWPHYSIPSPLTSMLADKLSAPSKLNKVNLASASSPSP